MKVYRIVFYAYAIVALYNFVYVTFLQDRTYFKYIREFHIANPDYKSPTYVIGEDYGHIPDMYECYGISDLGKYLDIIYRRTYLDVIILFFPLLIYALIMFFIKKKYLDRRWWITQLVGFACLFYILIVISRNM